MPNSLDTILGRIVCFHDTTQTIPSGIGTPLIFNQNLEDNINGHIPGNSVITVTDNFNLIRLGCRFAFVGQAVPLGTCRMDFFKNGAALNPSFAIFQAPVANVSTFFNNVSYWIPCQKDDQFTLIVTQGSGGNLNVIQSSVFWADLAKF